MAFEEIRAAIDLLMNEIAQRPEDRHALQEQLREKLAELSTLGLAPPADLAALERALEEDPGDDEQRFDNMPV